MRRRQGRLKKKFWSYYPLVQSGIWQGAVEFARSVLYHHRGRPTFASLAGRPLPKEHFEFREGDAPRQRHDAQALDRCKRFGTWRRDDPEAPAAPS